MNSKIFFFFFLNYTIYILNPLMPFSIKGKFIAPKRCSKLLITAMHREHFFDPVRYDNHTEENWIFQFQRIFTDSSKDVQQEELLIFLADDLKHKHRINQRKSRGLIGIGRYDFTYRLHFKCTRLVAREIGTDIRRGSGDALGFIEGSVCANLEDVLRICMGPSARR